ncbi:pickpocket protein 28-like [Chrysoperla carnea]|uniref:pickpocket protein 28-like n=1 Tax=Chrysoperla carnea TaxID=189513 RepID=UPI001D07B4DF|nr:pickpocket protein 28-like [Chrysoperla carnea]
MYDQNHHNDNYRPTWMGNTKYSNDSPKYWTSKTQKRLTNVSYITGPSSQENEYNQTRYNQNHPKTLKKEQMKLKNGMSLFSTLKMQFTDYCEHSTLHGLRYVGDQRMSIIERCFWAGAFITAVCVAAFFISNIYNKWENSPVIISISPTYTELDTIPFPAITVCNLNQARKSEALNILEEGSELEKRLLEDFCNSNNSFADAGSQETEVETGNWENVGQSCTEMLHLCYWKSISVKCEDYFNSALTDEGLCCSFNKVHRDYQFHSPSDYGDLNQTYVLEPYVDWTPERGYHSDEPIESTPKRTTGAGTHLGLTLILDAQIENYYCSSTTSVGFKIVLHSPVENPRVSAFGFLASPSRVTRVLIKPQISESSPNIRSIDIAKRQCYFANERNLTFYRTYTQKNCHLECIAKTTLRICNCVPYHLPKNKSTRICNRNKEECTTQVKLSVTEISKNDHECKCLPACFEITYDRQSSNAIIDRSVQIRTDYLAGKSQKYFEKNMAILEFYFETKTFTKNVKGELFGFTDFLSSTGGLLGLFLGFSFLSAVELFYYITIKVCKTNLQRNKDTVYPFTK